MELRIRLHILIVVRKMILGLSQEAAAEIGTEAAEFGVIRKKDCGLLQVVFL